MTIGKNWHTIMEHPSIDLEGIYGNAICQIALSQIYDQIDYASTKTPEVEYEAPVIDDPREFFSEISSGGGKPEWFPRRLDRLSIRIKAIRDGEAPEAYGPHAFDPNSADLGCRGFRNLLINVCEAIGTPFTGSIKIEIEHIKNKKHVGGWRGEVEVGEKRKSKGRTFSNLHEDMEAHLEYLSDQNQKKDAALLAMFSQSTQVIHASAAALNAVRGHNMASPWMNGEEGPSGIDPLWLQLGREAMKIAGPLLVGGKQPGAQHAAQMMNTPIQRGHPQAYGAQQGYQQPLLTDDQQAYIDPAGPPEEEEYGDYEGMYIADDHIVDDGFDEPEYGYNPEMDDYNHDYYAAPGTTELTGAVEEGGGTAPSNPLEGMNPDQVHQHLEKWIDNQKDKGALKNLGINLAQKLF